MKIGDHYKSCKSCKILHIALIVIVRTKIAQCTSFCTACALELNAHKFPINSSVSKRDTEDEKLG